MQIRNLVFILLLISTLSGQAQFSEQFVRDNFVPVATDTLEGIATIVLDWEEGRTSSYRAMIAATQYTYRKDGQDYNRQLADMYYINIATEKGRAWTPVHPMNVIAFKLHPKYLVPPPVPVDSLKKE